MVLNLGVRVDTDNQVVAHSLGLTKSIEVTYISIKEEQVGPRWLDDDESWLPFILRVMMNAAGWLFWLMGTDQSA